MVFPYQNLARLEAVSSVINSVERKRFSLAQLVYAEPKRRRAAYLIDEAKVVVDILKLDIGAEGQVAWSALLKRVEGSRACGAAGYLEAAEVLWEFTVYAEHICKEAKKVLDLLKHDIRPEQKARLSALKNHTEATKNEDAKKYLDAAGELWRFTITVARSAFGSTTQSGADATDDSVDADSSPVLVPRSSPPTSVMCQLHSNLGSSMATVAFSDGLVPSTSAANL
ncbi:hypothetical protein FOMPIDRAFT_1055785 [Fomitopsis schrenkii]|uniref:Uncharacterized protein n=1 Tax=Fomitopsis schrenkii TaxID=2126942 RepID=S8DQY4_FOMSC|nr:hypothetical protein FOMPIDRAFT_1055785 [Fomitopsis schrenkii]